MQLGYVGTRSRQLRWILGSTAACGVAAVALVAYWLDDRVEKSHSSPADSEPNPVKMSPDIPVAHSIPVTDVGKPVETMAPPEPAEAEETPELPEPKLVMPVQKVCDLEMSQPEAGEPTEVAPVPEQELPEALIETSSARQPKSETALSDPSASQAFLDLWKRVPEFDNRLMALLASWQSGASPLERRRGVERLECSVESICVSSEQRWEAVITNLGVGGAELLHPDYVDLNTRLALVPKSRQTPVTGRVAWILPEEKGYRIGLCFDSEPEVLSRSWVAETLLELGSAFLLKRAPRRYVRVSTDVPSCLMTDDGRQIEVVLKDVSLGGCLLQSSEPFEVEEITLRLGSVDCRGVVVNHRGCSDTGWSHHVHFAPLGPLETLKLLRTISVLLKKG